MSFAAATAANELARALALLGMAGAYYRPDDDQSGPGVPVRFLLRHPGGMRGLRDEPIANAYGVDAQIITLAHVGPFTTRAPQKFDAIVQGGHLRYVFDAVICRAVDGAVIAWTAYVRGKGG